MYDLNFQSIFWACYKFFQTRNATFDYYMCSMAFPLLMYEEDPGIAHIQG